MCFMNLCSSEGVYPVYESIVLASGTVSVGVNVFRTRFNIYTLHVQEPTVCEPGELGPLPL